ncbi:MAG: precorrin-3B C(17)-methyltransferase [Ardenticatenia bacterium]|nr:precorrin-3B C(17)-methyltransferase [Ardenticatenia bacterium]
MSTNTGLLSLISLGPGHPDYMIPAARLALETSEVVVGYRRYVDLARTLLRPHQEVRPWPIGTELARAEDAVNLATAGRHVALVSSGDVGVYGMAAPLFDILRRRGWDGAHPEVAVYPGVTAMQAAAARLGAPLGHDFCAISLSDLLTPWPVIERRLVAAAWGDFVIALYNPRSHKRSDHLEQALHILRRYRRPETPVAFARNLMRPDEQVHLTTLAEADPSQADMLTLVIVGNSESYTLAGRMVTPRGYTRAEEEQTARPPRKPPDIHTVYPVVLTDVVGARAVVVGGGRVAERKVRGLLTVGARVRVISPEATGAIRQWALEGRLDWEPRPYRVGDVLGARLVFAATDVRAVNAQVAREADELGVLCNVADAPHEGTFHLPAVHRGEGVVVAVSTAGADPARARDLRDHLAEVLS